MTTSVFETVLTFTLQHENKSSMDPHDPGNWTGGKPNHGELKGTKYGISAKAYPHLDIQNLTFAEARWLYYRDYWLASGAARLADKHPQLAMRLFDLAVNCGPVTAGKLLQRAVNRLCLGVVPANRRAKWREALARIMQNKTLQVDGIIGPITRQVIAGCPYPQALHAALRGEAYLHYAKQDPGYLCGWLTRLDAAI